MVTTIKVVIKFDHEPSTEYLDSYTDCMIELVDDYCNHRPRSFHLDPPKPEQIVTFAYRWIIDVCDASAHAEELFKLIKDITVVGKLLFVNVLDHEFDPEYKSKQGFCWTNDGETWCHDSERPYVDAYYDFHVNDYQDYTIIHIPTYIQRMLPRDREHYEKSGATFMWRCTACWDNFMKATTIKDAIEEFEVMYKKKLWQAVEADKKSLDKAIDAFSEFDTYRWNKRW